MKQKPTVKIPPKRFAATYIAEGQNGTKAVMKLDPAASKEVAAVKSSRMLRNDNVRKAIEDALKVHGATPEYAVGVLKDVADQDKEIGAKRLAAKDILELHGWQRGDRPNITLDIKNASFFAATRNNTN